jgi:tetratricopeptide (TPR) repeat protein
MKKAAPIYLLGLVLSTVVVGWLNVDFLRANRMNKVGCSNDNISEAMDNILSAITIHGSNPQYYLNLGLLHAQVDSNLTLYNLLNNNQITRSEEIDSAITLFGKALLLNDKDVCALLNLGLLYWVTGDRTNAETSLQQAHHNWPNNQVVLTCIGLYYETAREYKQAEEYYALAASYSPEIFDSRFYEELRIRNKYLADNVLYRTIDIVSQRIFSDDSPIEYARMGRLYMIRGDVNSAEIWLKKSVEMLPNMNRPYLYMGQISLRGQDTTAARRLFNKALLLDAADVLTLYSLSTIETDTNKRKSYDLTIRHIARYFPDRIAVLNFNVYKAQPIGQSIVIQGFDDYIKTEIELLINTENPSMRGKCLHSLI